MAKKGVVKQAGWHGRTKSQPRPRQIYSSRRCAWPPDALAGGMPAADAPPKVEYLLVSGCLHPAPRTVSLNSMRHHRPIHRITNWLVILGYALIASGLPLPVARWPAVAPGGAAAQREAEQRLAGKDRTQPFPCMDKPCGCATAEQCFASCCCHTPAQRLAWARAHRVAPAVVAALEHRVSQDTAAAVAAQAVVPTSTASCCSVTPACCAAGGEAASVTSPECCADARASQRPAPDAGDANRSPPEPVPVLPEDDRPQTVSLRAMLACGGIVAQWCAAGAALPPPPVAGVLPLEMVERIGLRNEAAAGIPAAPAVPPPTAA